MKLIDQPMPTVKENMALVESLYTVVSAGTERGLASFGGKNLIQKALERKYGEPVVLKALDDTEEKEANAYIYNRFKGKVSKPQNQEQLV